VFFLRNFLAIPFKIILFMFQEADVRPITLVHIDDKSLEKKGGGEWDKSLKLSKRARL